MIYKPFAVILRSKTRCGLTVISIAIGVFSVVLISAISATGTSEIGKTLDQMGINSILVQPNLYTFASLNENDVETIKNLDKVKKAMPLMAESAEAELLGKNMTCYSWGVNKDAREIISLEAKHGRLINSSDTASAAMVCVIDEEIALSTYGRSNITGKTARLLIGGSFYDFEVIGVAKSGISSLQSSLSNIIPKFVYIPITTMQTLTGRGSYDKVAVLIDGDSGTAVAGEIEKRLAPVKGEGVITAANLLQQRNQLEKIIRVITLVLTIIAGISLLVSGLSVMTTMLVSVNERKREIGIKKSIGANDSDICLEFLLESFFLSLTGSGIGAVFALSVAYLGCLILEVGFSVSISALFAAVAISIIMGVLFGVYPAAKAARLDPIEALRY